MSPNKKVALITGVNGQDGSYLAEYLLSLDYVVVGMLRRTSSINRHRIDHIRDKDFHLVWGDITDPVSVAKCLQDFRPDEIYNLAAQSHVGVSFDTPVSTGEITGMGASHLLHLVHALNPQARVYNAGTSELFGGEPGQAPQSEETPFHPKSPYGVAKLNAFWTTVNAREAFGLYAVNGILFNHESPRRGHNFVTKKAAVSAVKIVQGDLDCEYFGNLDAVRDWGYAPEYVQAMHKMLNQNAPIDFVIGTGVSLTVRDFITGCFQRLDVDLEWSGEGEKETGRNKKTGKIVIAINPDYFRPSEVEVLIADPSFAKEQLNWEANTYGQDLIDIMVDHELKFNES
jgi:GDPmannose 4,6-dehydratase